MVNSILRERPPWHVIMQKNTKNTAVYMCLQDLLIRGLCSDWMIHIYFLSMACLSSKGLCSSLQPRWFWRPL